MHFGKAKSLSIPPSTLFPSTWTKSNLIQTAILIVSEANCQVFPTNDLRRGHWRNSAIFVMIGRSKELNE